MNHVDVILIILLALIFAGAVRIMISNRKKGKGCHACQGGYGCGGGCTSCSHNCQDQTKLRRSDSSEKT